MAQVQQQKMRLMQVTEDGLVFLAEPIHPNEDAPPPHPEDQPGLVVIFGWMGAGHSHLQKYTDAYRLLFPAASIMLIRSQPSGFLRSTRAQLNALRPAHALLAARYHSTKPGTSSPILVHTFSNGGGTNLKTLNSLFEESHKKALKNGASETDPLLAKDAGPSLLPARAFVFDSLPGGTKVVHALRAFSAPIKSPILKYLAYGVLGSVFYLWKALNWFIRAPGPIEAMYRYLTESIAPVPRLYIYSPQDQLVPAADVEAHAAAARAKGIDVTMEKFEGTSHVAHVRGGSERYWGAVKSLWLGKTA
ncbi:hypothetical protein T439DRAFT_329132 [Meredithblackwellia eburnea MCA 4105]